MSRSVAHKTPRIDFASLFAAVDASQERTPLLSGSEARVPPQEEEEEEEEERRLISIKDLKRHRCRVEAEHLAVT